jgi:Protein of unknown function (DUF429)
MFFTNTTYIGIDPSAGLRPFIYAALDQDLRPMVLGEGKIDDVLAFLAGQRQAIVAIASPRQPNLGVMADGELRRQLSPSPRSGRWVDFRLADYLIRQHNISVPQTPASEEACPNWMRMGFRLYSKLDALGYREYPHADATRQFLEVYPHACFTVMLGLAPFPKTSLEGRIQRQLVLYEQKLKIPDPMLFFEEITSHRLLNGVLPVEHLSSPGELDALVSAYTAWVAGNHPDQLTLLGDVREGQVAIPSRNLKPHYPIQR